MCHDAQGQMQLREEETSHIHTHAHTKGIWAKGGGRARTFPAPCFLFLSRQKWACEMQWDQDNRPAGRAEMCAHTGWTKRNLWSGLLDFRFKRWREGGRMSATHELSTQRPGSPIKNT